MVQKSFIHHFPHYTRRRREGHAPGRGYIGGVIAVARASEILKWIPKAFRTQRLITRMECLDNDDEL